MGQALRKFCADDDATNEAPCVHELKRAETLMAGQEVQQQFRFSKSAILLKLNEDQTQFTWRTLRSSKSDKLRVADLRSVEARGAQLHVLLLPSRDDLVAETDDYRLLRDRSLAAGLPLIEVLGALRATRRIPRGVQRAAYLYLDEMHLQPYAHTVVAEELERALPVRTR